MAKEMIAVMSRCVKTKKLFGIRFDTNNGKSWEAAWAFPLKECADKCEKGYANTLKGSFGVGKDYPCCSHCGNPTFSMCGICGKISCWDGKTKHVICANCGSEIYLNSPITEIRGDGNF